MPLINVRLIGNLFSTSRTGRPLRRLVCGLAQAGPDMRPVFEEGS